MPNNYSMKVQNYYYNMVNLDNRLPIKIGSELRVLSF
jgi:hypothetical protein